ncbi:hypothetical protein ES703_75392 [subsurface metagenome]
MEKPKWATPSRQAYLVKLWAEYGNKCLYGHTTCPIASHYVYLEPKAVAIAVPIKLACFDSEGNPRKVDGKQVYLTVYGSKTIATQVKKLARLYEVKSELAIKDWKAEDRQQDSIDWLEERKFLHSLAERRLPIRGQFSNIAKDVFYNEQPSFYLLGLGVSGLTFKPFARIRLASSYLHLFIDIGDTLKGVGKNKRRKAIRYGKALPVEKQRELDQVCKLAVTHYLEH